MTLAILKIFLGATQVAVKSKFRFLMPLTIQYNKSAWICWVSINFTIRSIAQNNEIWVMYIYVRIGIYHDLERIFVILENIEHKVKCYSYWNIKTLCVSCNRRIANLPIIGKLWWETNSEKGGWSDTSVPIASWISGWKAWF